MKKGDVGMLNTSIKSTETRDELLITHYIESSVLSGCLPMPDATSLPRTIVYLKLTSRTLRGLFQLHGGMVSHMQVLATPSSIVHNTKYLDPYH